MDFDAGNTVEVEGINIILSPKVEKFITMVNLTTGKKSNLELMEYCNPNLAHWYNNVPKGTEIDLEEIHQDNLKGIYSQDNSNSL